MKRAVKDGYEFVTAPMYSRWQIRVMNAPWMDGTVWALLDHRFRVNGVWRQLGCRLMFGHVSRRELAILVGSMRSAILALKHQEKVA